MNRTVRLALLLVALALVIGGAVQSTANNHRTFRGHGASSSW